MTIGAGVVISDDGDILTDYHVVAEVFANTNEQRAAHPIKIHIGSKNAPLEYETSYETGDPQSDIALLRIKSPGDFGSAPFCYQPNLQLGAYLFAFGYPNDRVLSPIPGTFSNIYGDTSRWVAAMPTAQGMSGGPVYNERGYLVGLVKGGIDATSIFITPLRWAKRIIESRSDAKPSCYSICRTPENGVEKWQLTTPWSESSDWLGGGHSQAEICNSIMKQYLSVHTDQDLVITETNES